MTRGAALACVAMLAAACSSSSSSAGPSADPSASGVSPSSAPSASTAPASPTVGATSPPSGIAGTWSGYGPCPHLQVTLGLSQRDPTVTYQVIDFTNRGSVTCIIDGYPGVSLAAGSPPAPIGLPAAHNPSAPPKPVTLTPGGVANALLQITAAHTYAKGSCGPVQAHYLIVYLPNEDRPAKLPYAATGCSKQVRMMQISVVSRGTGG